ncbi:hypothetical protein SAMN04488548_134997 [Gordonia westfalica]|uniref:Uncharacterized protein n=1 Tax=Gordonia westfalica TaxID=158898 RepID=A0A1H2IAQ8_9ACTN|nr:hypothetical protein SAMN04488548_134997 [Gordonia westfalica]
MSRHVTVGITVGPRPGWSEVPTRSRTWRWGSTPGSDRTGASCHPKPVHRFRLWSPLGYKTAFNAAEFAAEKFSSCWVWYSFHAAESQISR